MGCGAVPFLSVLTALLLIQSLTTCYIAAQCRGLGGWEPINKSCISAVVTGPSTLAMINGHGHQCLQPDSTPLPFLSSKTHLLLELLGRPWATSLSCLCSAVWALCPNSIRMCQPSYLDLQLFSTVANRATSNFLGYLQTLHTCLTFLPHPLNPTSAMFTEYTLTLCFMS